jgi:hypothetical protein
MVPQGIRAVFLFMFALFIWSGAADACICVSNEKDYILEHAHFIGVVSVEQAEEIHYEPVANDDPNKLQKAVEQALMPDYAYKFRILKSYKGNIPSGETVYGRRSGCDGPAFQKDETRRIILFKNSDEKLYLAAKCAQLKPEDWAALEKDHESGEGK